MRKILIVIDMQNDFIDAALGTKEAVAIVEAVKEKIRSYPAENIIATMDTHGENYMETQEGKNLPVPHCIKGSDGWQIRPDIAQLLTGARIYEKPTFGSIALAADLKAVSEKEEIELELVGLCTDICVVSNAILLKSFHAGGKDLGRRSLLRRCYARKASGRTGNHALLPDLRCQRMSHVMCT